jgi:nucleoside-diphosphate-sugar epimerase
MATDNWLINYDDQILVTGAGGFIGRRVVSNLLEKGFIKIRGLRRPSTIFINKKLHQEEILNDSCVQIIEGNLLSREDCINVVQGVKVIFHLAAGRGEKSFPDAYLNSVVTTRNLLDACLQTGDLKRFVNVSSFSVYSNRYKPAGRVLNEYCPIEQHPDLRGDAYCFAKVKQEEIVIKYGKERQLPYVVIRPGVVYGPGNEGIHGRVGIGTFGIFLHLGGSNKIPFSYVDNCAEAIVLGGLVKEIDGENFNVVDDDLLSSRRFLRLYKRQVDRFSSIYMPRIMSYTLCYLWEKWSAWSRGQLPNAYNRNVWHAAWKKTTYTNEKLKQGLGWKQKVPTNDGLNRYFESCREKKRNA